MIPFESKRVDFQQIVYSIIDPLLQMCSLSAAKLGVIEMGVYLVNCISAIRTTLAVFAFTDEKIEMLEGQVRLPNKKKTVSNISISVFILDRCKYRYINRRTSDLYSPSNGSLRCLSYRRKTTARRQSRYGCIGTQTRNGYSDIESRHGKSREEGEFSLIQFEYFRLNLIRIWLRLICTSCRN